jgi:hypothetical protein
MVVVHLFYRISANYEAPGRCAAGAMPRAPPAPAPAPAQRPATQTPRACSICAVRPRWLHRRCVAPNSMMLPRCRSFTQPSWLAHVCFCMGGHALGSRFRVTAKCGVDLPWVSSTKAVSTTPSSSSEQARSVLSPASTRARLALELHSSPHQMCQRCFRWRWRFSAD